VVKNWLEELMSLQQRRAPRHIEPRLVAFYWDGAVPEPHYLQDVSSTGPLGLEVCPSEHGDRAISALTHEYREASSGSIWI
jgi:hypothetical protein